MKKHALSFAVAIVAMSLAAFTGSAQARNIGGGLNNGPIIITGPIDCERDLVYRCRMVGNFYVCGWVPGPCRTF